MIVVILMKEVRGMNKGVLIINPRYNLLFLSEDETDLSPLNIGEEEDVFFIFCFCFTIKTKVQNSLTKKLLSHVMRPNFFLINRMSADLHHFSQP